MIPDPYTPAQRGILNYLEERSNEADPSGEKPPILIKQETILQAVPAATGSDLFDLEVLGILTHDTSNGETYVGFHPAIVAMPPLDFSWGGSVYVIDEDLICQRCGKVQSSSCAMGTCAT